MQITVRADVCPKEYDGGSVSVAVDGIKAIDIDLGVFQAQKTKKEEYHSQPTDALPTKTEAEKEKEEEEKEEEEETAEK